MGKHFKITLESKVLPLEIEGLYSPEIRPEMNKLICYQPESLQIWEVRLNGTPVWNLLKGEQIEALQNEILCLYREKWELRA